MKHFLATLLFLAATCTFIFAQQNAVQEPVEVEVVTTENVPGPAIAFETTEVNYGEIEQGSDPYRYFKFKNTGDAPLVIQHAKGSCGCTVPQWPKEPILPGEAGEIKVRYDTKRIGPFTKYVTLTTNAAQENGRVQLKITGKVNKPAEQPAAVPASNGSGLFNNGNTKSGGN